MTRTQTTWKCGDVVRVRIRGNRTRLLEVSNYYPDLDLYAGNLPYATTYTPGGRYQGSYRGAATAYAKDVIALWRPAS